MGFPWKQILAGAKIGAGIAAGIVTGGAAAPVVAMIPGLVATVEELISEPQSGLKKKTLVLQMAMFAIASAEGITQKDLIENEAAMDAIDAMIDASVAFYNAINRPSASQ